MDIETARRIYKTVKRYQPHEEYANETEQRRADVIITLGDYIEELELQIAGLSHEIRMWSRSK